MQHTDLVPLKRRAFWTETHFKLWLLPFENHILGRVYKQALPESLQTQNKHPGNLIYTIRKFASKNVFVFFRRPLVLC